MTYLGAYRDISLTQHYKLITNRIDISIIIYAMTNEEAVFEFKRISAQQLG